jgi:hypothetical protein
MNKVDRGTATTEAATTTTKIRENMQRSMNL